MSLRTAYPTFFIFLGWLRHLPADVRRLPARLSQLRLFTWRNARRLLFAGAAFVTLIALVYAVENWRGRRAFAAATSEAAAAGISLDIRSYAQAPIRDDQNLAKIPRLDAPTDEESRQRFWEDFGQSLCPQNLPDTKRSSSNEIPTDGWPSLFEHIPADLGEFRTRFQDLANQHSHENFNDYIARLTPVLNEIELASASRPYLRYDHDFDELYGLTLPEYGVLHDLGRTASLHALIALEKGNTVDASRFVRLPLRLTTAVHRDPFLISQLIAANLAQLSYNSIWQGQLAHAWTTAELDAFSTLLEQDTVLAGYRTAFAVEAAAGSEFILRIAAGRNEFTTDDPAYQRLFTLLGFLPSGWLYQNAAGLTRAHLENSLASIDPAGGRVRPEMLPPRLLPRIPLHQFHPYTFVALILTVDPHRICLRAGQAKTAHDLARVAIALEQHLLAHGTYPDSLASLLATAPALGALHDPFDGQPYRYRRDPDGGFTLWGVGANGRDDGGTFPTEEDGGVHTNGDLAWQVPGR